MSAENILETDEVRISVTPSKTDGKIVVQIDTYDLLPEDVSGAPELRVYGNEALATEFVL